MQIRDIQHGEIITEPGAYRMPMSWYHAPDCCDGPSVSSSGLRTIIGSSPQHFWRTWSGNPDRPPEKKSPALDLGRAAHCLILGDDVFEESFAVRPAEWKDWRTKAAQEWRAEREAEGKTVLTDDQIETIAAMSRSLQESPEAVQALTGPLCEISLVWKDPITGVWIKSRPDMIPSNGCDFADLKTFSPTYKTDYLRIVQRAVTDNLYAMQMGLAAMGAEMVLGLTATSCALIFVQTSAPYTVVPMILDEDALYWGRVMCRKAIDTFAECMETGDWPGPAVGFATYSLPDSLLNRYAEMQADGALPNIER